MIFSKNESYAPLKIMAPHPPYRSSDGRFMVYMNEDGETWKEPIVQRPPAAPLPPSSAASQNVGTQDASVESVRAPIVFNAEDVGMYDASSESAVAPTEEDITPSTSSTFPGDIVMHDATAESAPAPVSTTGDAQVFLQRSGRAPRGARLVESVVESHTDYFHQIFFHPDSHHQNHHSGSARQTPYPQKKPQGVAPRDALTPNNKLSTSTTRKGRAPAGSASGDSSSNVQATPSPAFEVEEYMIEYLSKAGKGVTPSDCWKLPKLLKCLKQRQRDSLKLMAADDKCKTEEGRFLCVYDVNGTQCGNDYKTDQARDRHVNMNHLHSGADGNGPVPLPYVTGGRICPHCKKYIKRGDDANQRHIIPCKRAKEEETNQEAILEAGKKLANSTVKGG